MTANPTPAPGRTPAQEAGPGPLPDDQPVLLLPRWILPIRPARQLLSDHALLIRDGRIADLGPAPALLERHRGVPTRSLPGHLLMPGLINLHSHAAMSLLKGYADDMPLQQWLGERIWPAEGKVMSDAFVHDGTLLAGMEMLRGGITCFSDMYFFPEASVRAALALGMRCAAGIVMFEFPSAYGSGPDDYLAKGLAARDQMRGEPLISFTLAPHAPYTVSDESFGKVLTLASELDLPIHCHLHETAFEISQSLEQYGCRPLERLGRLGLVGPSLIAVHAVHLIPAEIELLARANASVAHCPHSNLKLGSGIAPVAGMLQHGVNLGIGTDGSASNNRLDLWQEGRSAALLAKGVSGDPSVFDAHALMEAMTLAGARALGLAGRIGSLEVGKDADLIAVDLGAPELNPVFDPVSHLAYSVGREHVQEVWIAGRHVVHKRQLSQAGAIDREAWVSGRSLMWQNTLGEIQAKPRIAEKN